MISGSGMVFAAEKEVSAPGAAINGIAIDASYDQYPVQSFDPLSNLILNVWTNIGKSAEIRSHGKSNFLV